MKELTILRFQGSPACGTYHLYVRIGGRLAVLDRELDHCRSGGMNGRWISDHTVLPPIREFREMALWSMDGYVTLNSWLHFKGKVRLDGDLAGTSITLTDAYGSYIQYEEGSSRRPGSADVKE